MLQRRVRQDLAVTSPLELPPEEMRRLGYRVIDRIVEHWATLDEQPPVVVGEAAALREALVARHRRRPVIPTPPSTACSTRSCPGRHGRSIPASSPASARRRTT